MRSLLTTAAIGALLSLGSAGAIANPYEHYEGTTVVVSWPALSHFQAAETLIEEFTEETGIEVEVDALQY
ncbi:MAG: sugar ABC transporter substrate-binding protein, partial [Geminicoccaceae bacterium]